MFSEVALPLSIMGMLVPFLIIGAVMAGGAILWGIWKGRQEPTEQRGPDVDRERDTSTDTGPEPDADTGPETRGGD